MLRWATVLARLWSLTIFSNFIAQRGIDEPRLCADRQELRLLALEFLGHVRARRASCGANRGELVTNGTVRHTIDHVERFYAFMADNKHEASRALGDPRWEALGDEHARWWRPGEKPRVFHAADEDVFFDDHTMAQVMRHAGLLGTSTAEGGIGDEQAMRIVMLLARTGRRVGELLLLDFDCLLAIPGLTAQDHDGDPDAVVAKLRFQQTKIEGAPNTIFVDARSSRSSKSSSGGCTARQNAAALRPRRHRATCSSRSPTTFAAATPTPRRPSPGACSARRAGRHPRQPRPAATAVARAPLPAHARDEPDQRRRPGARRPALPRPLCG